MTRSITFLLWCILATATFAQSPDLMTFAIPPTLIDRGLPFDLYVRYRDAGHTTATGVRMTVTIDGAERITSAPAGCTIAANVVTCDLGTVAPDESQFDPRFQDLVIRAIAPDANGAPVTITSTIRGNEGNDPDPSNDTLTVTTHTFATTILVTNANDSGSGSLRAAIEEANATCTDTPVGELCKIAFRFPAGAAAWTTIEPVTPLPAIVRDRVMVDGTTQTRLADTNPLGPEVEISGTRVASGNGLTLEGRCGGSVSGLAINAFPDNGIYLGGDACENREGAALRSIHENYLGTDPTGTKAIPNLRGLMIAPRGHDFFAPALITQNVISGNRHSGIWIANGPNTRILANVIGLTAGAKAPLGNGASGVYIGYAGSGTDLSNNYIGFNGHYGVALDRLTTNVHFASNSFQGNGNLAVDHGLDGVTPTIPDVGERPDHLLHAPVLTSARYDAASDTTVIEGTVDVRTEHGFRSIQVTFYANDAPDESGFGEGQYLLGYANADSEGRFTFTHRGRTPGAWIAATSSSYHIWGFSRTPGAQAYGGGYATTTSEFSRTIEVSR